jgi:hypothetical protein
MALMSATLLGCRDTTAVPELALSAAVAPKGIEMKKLTDFTRNERGSVPLSSAGVVPQP